MTLIITMDFTLFLTQQLNYVLSLSENLMAAAIRMLISTTTVSAQILHLLYLQSQLQ
jgi:hypothetical protein